MRTHLEVDQTPVGVNGICHTFVEKKGNSSLTSMTQQKTIPSHSRCSAEVRSVPKVQPFVGEYEEGKSIYGV